MWSRIRPTTAARSGRSNAPPAASQAAPRQMIMPAGSLMDKAYRRAVTRGSAIASPAALTSGPGDRFVAGGLPNVAAPLLPKLCPQAARRDVRLGLENTACEPVYHHRVATRG